MITAASEIMAIMALASSRADLRHRIDSIVVGPSRSGQPVTAADLGATGAMLALLDDAIKPNLVQTTEGTPALVHTGPFGNIAHGTSSILAHKMGVRLADYVVNECGFAADLGAEKYFDIVMRFVRHSTGGCGSGGNGAKSARAGRRQAGDRALPTSRTTSKHYAAMVCRSSLPSIASRPIRLKTWR